MYITFQMKDTKFKVGDSYNKRKESLNHQVE
jgi:hypothetical protein